MCVAESSLLLTYVPMCVACLVLSSSFVTYVCGGILLLLTYVPMCVACLVLSSSFVTYVCGGILLVTYICTYVCGMFGPEFFLCHLCVWRNPLVTYICTYVCGMFGPEFFICYLCVWWNPPCYLHMYLFVWHIWS